MLRHTLPILLFFCSSLLAITPEEILQKADSIRNPEKSFFMKIKVITTGEDDSLFEVSTEGKDKTHIKTLLPERNRGRNLLMVQENMWVYIPNLKRSVRVSLSQKLTGQTANGDIGRMRWSGDYLPLVTKETDKEWTLKLTAQKKGLTYEQMEVVVNKSDFHPLKANYMAGTGKLLKTAEFSNYKNLCGAIRPSTITIQSATNQNEKSTMEIMEMEEKIFPASLFDQNSLR